jgi:hypothetical protein
MLQPAQYKKCRREQGKRRDRITTVKQGPQRALPELKKTFVDPEYS